ncbi:MAG: signal peptidase II [Clostridiales bacterium]|nr:signal peptidase II [Clostridiales bacterium]
MALALLLMGTLVITDQLTKYMVVNFLMPVGSVPVIGDFFKFTYLENRGAAFGIFQNQRWIFIVLTFAILAVMLWISFRYEIKSKMLFASLVLVAAGGIGNLIDRIFLGYVIDFISFSFFPPIFNFADCCITVGAVMLLVSMIFIKNPAEKKIKED